jgi:ferritin-like metal-binding protein YciE
MSQSEQKVMQQKVMQYLNEAHASEIGLVRELQSQIAMTPRGSYRSGLESHLDETRGHARRLEERVGELGRSGDPLQAALGFAEGTVSQILALGKAPFTLLRGSGGEEKVLKNAKDACGTEALEIATYTALEHLARSVGDETTAKLAASIRVEEEKMLERVLREIPKLTEAVVRAEVKGEHSYDLSDTGAADAVREAGDAGKRTVRKVDARARRAARGARKVPGVAQAEGRIKGATASEDDLAIAGYEKLTAAEIVGKLSELSQIELAKVDSYERRNQSRSTILSRIVTLRDSEPWPGYDELNAEEIHRALAESDDEERANKVRRYERSHKKRAGVIAAAERETASSQAAS